MYNDFKSQLAGRESWKFEYKGSDLVPFAQATLAKQQKIVADCLAAVQEMLAAPGANLRSNKKMKVEQRSMMAADRTEQCMVWVHEFMRSPDRVFNLGLSDVVFFGIVSSGDPATDDED